MIKKLIRKSKKKIMGPKGLKGLAPAARRKIRGKNKIPPHQICYFDRRDQKMEKEHIYGDGFLRFLYENKKGRFWAGIISHGLFSKLSGLYQNSSLSKKEIPRFIEKFKINMAEYVGEVGRSKGKGNGKGKENEVEETFPYKNFNEFFTRKFRPGVRPFVKEKRHMPAFAEGKYLAYKSMIENETYIIKGKSLTIGDILQDSKWERIFSDGPIFISRLCPVDYHRFHFPDDGEIIYHYRLPGKFHSVSPLALRRKQNIFAINERQVTIIQTKNFGRCAYIEIGALAVGKIKQTHSLVKPFKRGDEKGLFLFGGSTVILIGERGCWLPDQDLLEMSERKIETFVRLGEKIAQQSQPQQQLQQQSQLQSQSQSRPYSQSYSSRNTSRSK